MLVAMIAANLALVVAAGFADMPLINELHPVVRMGGFILILTMGLLIEGEEALGDGNVGAEE